MVTTVLMFVVLMYKAITPYHNQGPKTLDLSPYLIQVFFSFPPYPFPQDGVNFMY